MTSKHPNDHKVFAKIIGKFMSSYVKRMVHTHTCAWGVHTHRGIFMTTHVEAYSKLIKINDINVAYVSIFLLFLFLKFVWLMPLNFLLRYAIPCQRFKVISMNNN